jgi:DNA-directed RNA polymerase subunit RPC12/RpoP
MYIKVDEEKNLVNFCKNCGHHEVKKREQNESICIIDDNKISDQLKYMQYINDHLVHDPALPRVNDIPCPNSACTKPAAAENEIIYMNYNAEDMKYVYYCVHCKRHFVQN